MYNPVEIQLQYLPDTVLLGMGVASHPAFLTEESRTLALSVHLQGFSTSPAHRSRESEFLLGLIFLLSLPLLNPWVRGDGVGYYALVRAPLIEQRLEFHSGLSIRESQFS